MIDWLLSQVTYRPTLFTGDEWDRQYAAGRWDFLQDVRELAHHSIIAGYFRRYGFNGSVLDVCCGEGILQGILGNESYLSYVGVDISREAINKAMARANSKTTFFFGDVATFNPSQRFEVIVFNECLYYFEDPIDLLRRYENFLSEGGVFVVSMYVQRQPRRIWRMIDSLYQVEDETRVTNGAGASWSVKAIRRGGAGSPVRMVSD